MSEELSRGAHEILQRLVAGDLDPEGPEGRALLEGDAKLRAAYESLLALAARLDAAAAQEREVLSSVEHQPQPGPPVRRILENIWSRQQRERRVFRLTLAAAAAVLLVLTTLALLHGLAKPERPPGAIELGGQSITCLAPLGEVRSYGTFRWRSGLPPGYTYRLIITDASSGREVHRVEALSEPEWMPAEALEASLPREILWTVQARMPGSEDAVLSGTARARLKDN
ncbi:MAG: hypothetical protein AB1486_04670 [Planctomycetota bacterium]